MKKRTTKMSDSGSNSAMFRRCFLFVCFAIFSIGTFAQQITGTTSVCSGQEYIYALSGISADFDWDVTGGTITAVNTDRTEITVHWNQAPTGLIEVNTGTGTYTLDVTIKLSPDPKINSVQEMACSNASIPVKGGLIRDEREAYILASVEPTCMIACENTSIRYYTSYTSGNTYTWTVTGASSFQATNNEINVIWGDSGSGIITLTETNASGCSTIVSTCFEIIDAPVALFTALPEPVANTVNVCRDQDVNFFDQSTDAVNWSWDFGDGTNSTAQNPIHSFDQAGTYLVTLTVGNGPQSIGKLGSGRIDMISIGVSSPYTNNTCNCTSTYTMTVVVAPDQGPKIECISTICAKETVTYSTPADCQNYRWSVEGGTILSTSDNEVTVEWGDGTSGLSYLTLDVGNCAGYCSAPTVAVIPLIPTELPVSGAQQVCYGSFHTYSVPQIAGVDYVWDAQGATITSGQGTNQITILWNPPFYGEKTYEIKLRYVNELLHCEGSAIYKVQVIPELFMSGNSNARICEGEINQSNTPIRLNNMFTGAGVAGNWSILTPGGVLLTDVVTNSTTFSSFVYAYGAGTYTVFARPASGVYCNDEVFQEIEVFAKPLAPESIAGPLSICGSAIANYTANSNEAGNFTWNVVGGTITATSANNVTVQWDAQGPYELSVYQTNANGCVSGSRSIAPVSIQQLAAPAISGANNACLGGSSSYSYAGSPNLDATYSWSVSPADLGNILSPLDAQTIDIAWSTNNQVSADATITLTLVSPCGEISTSSYVVHLYSLSVDFTLPSVICQDEDLTLSYSEPFSSLLWTIGGDSLIANQASYTHNFTEQGTYSVELMVTDLNGCSGTVAKLINVNPKPTAEITTPDENQICSGEPLIVNLQALNTSSSIPYTYEWYAEGNPTVLGTTSTLQVNQVGTYYAQFTNEYGCKANSSVIPVTIVSCTGGGFGCQIETHEADFTASVLASSCNTVTITLNNSANIRPISWSYSNVNNESFFISNEASPTFTIPKAGYYEIQMVYTGPSVSGISGDSAQCEIHRNVFLPLVADFEASFECTDDGVLVHLKDQSGYFAGGEVDTYSWKLDGTPFSTIQNPDLNVAAGTYTVGLELTNIANNLLCITNKTVVVPEAIAVQMDFVSPVCPGTQVFFTSSTTGGNPISRTWTFSGGIASSSEQNPDRQFIEPGDYDVSLMVKSAIGCVDQITGSITVLENENGEITPDGPTTICLGAEVVLNAPAGNNYLWSNGETTQSISVSAAGTYRVTVTGTNGCAYTTAGVVVKVNTPSPIEIRGESSMCELALNTLNVTNGLTASAGFVSYNWSYDLAPFDNVADYQITSGFNYIPPTSVGTYAIQVQGIDANGCVSTSEIFLFTVKERPDAPLIATLSDLLPCAGTPATIFVHSPVVGVTYRWSTGQIGNSIVVSQAGNYTVTAQSNNGCTAISPVPFSIYPTPDVSSFMSGCYSICEDRAPFIIHGIDGNRNDWYLQNQNSSTFVGSRTDLPVFQSGTYYAVVSNGICSAQTETISIEIVPLPEVLITVNQSQICEGSTAVLTASGASTYQWYGPEGSLGTGSSITVTPANGSTYSVTGTDNGLGCSKSTDITLFVTPYTASATIDCCEDKTICKGTSASIPVQLTGSGPWTFTYTDGINQTTVTTSSNLYNIVVSPTVTTTYSLVSVSGSQYGCTEVCGKATVAVNTCTAPIAVKGKKQADCSKNCFSTTLLSVVDNGSGCKTVKLRVSCNNTCAAALSHYTVSVACGTVTSMSNTLGSQMGKVTNDPTTGLSGFKVDNIQDFCEDKEAGTFDITYTVCTNESTCGNGDYCAPLVAYKAGTCVNYGITSNPSNLKSIANADVVGGETNLMVYPNPFNEATTIALELPRDTETELAVYDLNGKKLAELHSGELSAGTSVFTWDGTNNEGAQLPDGLYYIKCKTNDEYKYVKVMYVK